MLRFAPFLILLCCAFTAPLFGQDPVLLGTEIQNLERILEKPGIDDTEKHAALRRLARLQELSGNMERAAGFWILAAGGKGGVRDDEALLRGACAFSAMGEWEKAGEAVKTLLLSAGDRDILLDARLLGAQIEGFRSGNSSILMSLLDNRDYEPFKSVIYYTLWKIQGDEAWKNRLLAECSPSPEGRIAAGDTVPVNVLPRAMWLLLPGRPGFSAETPDSAVSAPPVPANSTSAAPVPARNAGKPATLLQTGLFGRKENAGIMAEKLRNAGFNPSVGRRTVNGTGYWAVTVEPGQDVQRTILHLKAAGFESFPVYPAEQKAP
ncbi:MAG: SPOR domain-containing protein [Treponema sp.]|nr:SPOR domain-containing protein [Treponema sp.]